MLPVDALRAAERQAYPVQRNRIVAANGVQVAERRTPAHVIFGMYFEPRNVGFCLGDKAVMREAQPDSGMGGNRAALGMMRGRPGRGAPLRHGFKTPRSCRPGFCRRPRREA